MDRTRHAPEPAQTHSASDLRVFLSALERLGYDSGTLLSAAGVTREELQNPDGRLPCAAVGAVFGRAMAERPLPNLAARLAAETPIGAFPLLDYLVVTSDTVGEALRRLARYFRLTDAPVTVGLHEAPAPPRLTVENPGNPFAVEFCVAITVRHLRDETSGRLRVDAVHFRHAPDDVAALSTLLGCPVRANASWSGIALPHAALALPMRRRDSALHGLLERQAEDVTARLPKSDDAATAVRRVLAPRLAGGDTRISAVARALAVTPRTLQRRLEAEGLSYQELLDRQKREAAEGYLSTSSLSAAEVGYLLGYSEPSAFHRAFRRWNRTSPQAFRARAAGRPAPNDSPR